MGFSGNKIIELLISIEIAPVLEFEGAFEAAYVLTCRASMFLG